MLRVRDSLCCHIPRRNAMKLGCSICWLDTTERLLQVQLCFLVAAAALIGRASASQNEATFDFDYGFNSSAISMDMVDYTDSAGTALRVTTHPESST